MTSDTATPAGAANATGNEFSNTLRERAVQLLEKLDQGDLVAANELIRQINTDRDETLYNEIGRLTRALHNALKDFHLDIGLHGHVEVENELSEIADARSRLNYVITLTEEAANRTMDMVDESAPLVHSLAEEAATLHTEWQSAVVVSQGDELHTQVGQLLERAAGDGAHLHQRLNDILMAQGFQDLSGQVIKRVIDLVSDVERSLVRLVKLASDVEMVAGVSNPVLSRQGAVEKSDEDRLRAEGPQMQNSKNDVVSGQDDVDELLSSLGF